MNLFKLKFVGSSAINCAFLKLNNGVLVRLWSINSPPTNRMHKLKLELNQSVLKIGKTKL